MDNALSYNKIINDMWMFRRWSQGTTNEFAMMDQPGQFYFKIFFDFSGNGLLGSSNIDWMEDSTFLDQSLSWNSGRDNKEAYTSYTDSAYDFLVRNNELERASLMKNFIKLLSDINTDSPWYWQSVSGLDGLLERKMFSKEFKIEEEDPKITIKCLPDAFDTRIGTLLDMYRAICYSYTMKKEIVPINLRRFDMAIYIFHTPIASLHEVAQKTNTVDTLKNFVTSTNPTPTAKGYLGSGSSNTGVVSNKWIELRGCELSLNSSKSGYGEMSNIEGFGHEYTLEISVQDAFEARYNEVFGFDIGDYVLTDLNPSDDSFDGTTSQSAKNFKQLFNQEKHGFLEKMSDNMIGSVKGTVNAYVGSKAKSLALGNINGYSLANAQQMLSNPLAATKNAISQSLATNDVKDSRVGKKLEGYGDGWVKVSPVNSRQLYEKEDYEQGTPNGRLYEKEDYEQGTPNGRLYEKEDYEQGTPNGRLYEKEDYEQGTPNGKLWKNDENYKVNNGELLKHTQDDLNHDVESKTRIDDVGNKTLPHTPSFEEKRTQLLNKINGNKNIFNSL